MARGLTVEGDSITHTAPYRGAILRLIALMREVQQHDAPIDDAFIGFMDACVQCRACEPACPVTAIYAEDDVPANLKPYAEINVLWYKDKPAARAKVSALHPA